MISPDQVLVGSYDHGLVGLSVAIAIFASYAALDLAGRVTSARGWVRGMWLCGGATAMGIGIWSMHYVGMLAYRLPVVVLYDWPTVLVSLLAAVLASAIALFVVSRKKFGTLLAIAGSVCMGGAIAGMHYIGMAAMRLPAMCHYSTAVVAVSVALAIGISLVALLQTFHLREEKASGGWRKALSAVVMGSAVPVMHYTGMAAARFTPSLAATGDVSRALSISSLGTVGIILVTFMVLGLTVLTALVDRRFAEQALVLEASERRYRQILETAFDAFVGMDATGRITDWNARAEDLLGWKREETVGKTLLETIIAVPRQASYEQEILELMGESQGGVANRRFETRAMRRGGGEIPVEITISALHRAEANHFAAFVRDLTERERAEEKFKALLESSSEALLLVNREGRITAANSQAERLFGHSRTEMREQKIEMLLPERFRGKHPGQRANFFEHPQIRSMAAGFELYALRKDGSEFPVEISLSPLATEEGVLVSTLILDMTQRKQFEQDLRMAKEAAEAASEAKSTFLATMSHEIRTPMNGILGMTELVLDTELTAEQREHLGLVKFSAESLLSIINDILDFSKIEAGKLELESIAFDLRESLGDTMKTLSFRTHQKGLELVYEIAPDVPEALVGDPGRVRQILINLVGNAIKFTEHGEIAVTVQQEAEETSATRLHFAVRDTGIGIAAEKIDKVFEAFSQADGSMARKYGGTGLGLTICKRLVELMEGRIWLESELGQGSTFHFIIRLGVQERREARSPTFPAEQLKDARVLIVDDNFTNRRVLDRMLIRWGMRPTLAESGREAFEMLHAAKSTGQPYPLILLDGQMPEMDGFMFAERVRESGGAAGAKIVMLTSAGRQGDAQRCRKLGIAAYLMKPVRQGELLAAICALLQAEPEKKEEQLVTRHSLRENRVRYRVLLAEDNLVNQKLALRLLEKRGFEVTVAGDGQIALKELEKEAYHLVLMDMQMPNMDGFEATVAIRQKEKLNGGHIPIVAMTAHALKGDEERCIAAGMDAYVSKPIRTDELFATIERVLGKKIAADTPEGVQASEKLKLLG